MTREIQTRYGFPPDWRTSIGSPAQRAGNHNDRRECHPQVATTAVATTILVIPSPSPSSSSVVTSPLSPSSPSLSQSVVHVFVGLLCHPSLLFFIRHSCICLSSSSLYRVPLSPSPSSLPDFLCLSCIKRLSWLIMPPRKVRNKLPCVVCNRPVIFPCMQADGYISPTHHACAAVAATQAHCGPVSDAVQGVRVDSVLPSGATVAIAHATQEAETPFAALAADTESTENIVPVSYTHLTLPTKA